MSRKTLILLTLMVFSFRISHAWWNSSWNSCRDIYISPSNGIDFDRERELIEFWFDDVNQDNCDSIRIVNSSCDNVADEIKRYISYKNESGCEVRFQVSRDNNQDKIHSIYYGNPDVGISEISENYSIFGDNFENGLKREWNIEFNTSDFCGIFDKNGNRIFRANVTNGYGKCILNSSLESNIPPSVYLNFSAKALEGDRNHLKIYFINETYNKNDYFGIFNMIQSDAGTNNDPKLEAKASENTRGPSSNSGSSRFVIDGENFSEILEDPINDDFLHEAIFRYNPSSFSYNLFLDGSYKWTFRFSPDNVNWNNNKFIWRADFWNPPQTHTSDMDVVCIVTDDQECHVYNQPSLITLGEEQKLSYLELNISFPYHNFIDEETQVNTFVTHDKIPITDLTQGNFELFLDDIPFQIEKFQNFNNGTYILSTELFSNKLGENELKVVVNSDGQTSEKKEKISLLIHPDPRVVIITSNNWKNYISSTSLNQPVLIYNSSRKLIDKFIQEYQPTQLFQLDVNITSAVQTYSIDSRQTLVKIFFGDTDLIIPKDKETAIKSSFLKNPVLFEPSEKTLEFLNPETIHNILTTEQLDNLFKSQIPNPDYFILTNPDEEESMFSYPLTREKNAFILFSNDDPEDSKDILVDEITDFILPGSYHFDKTIYLTLIETPHFSVEDPVHDYQRIITDTNYCDINNDGYQDLSCGRLMGSPESLSYQLEYAKIFEEDKSALILASYNTPGKYFDSLSAGGTMLIGMKAEMELLKKGFEVKRLVEKRSEQDQLDSSVLDNLNDMAKALDLTKATTYLGLFRGIIGDFTRITIFMRASSKILYSIYEFDWLNFWRSILEPERAPPKHLPIFNEDNLINDIKDTQSVIYLSKGNESHWLIPINSTKFSTIYQELDPSTLQANTLFYYLGYSNSHDMRDKILNLGALSIVSLTDNFYNLYSGETSLEFLRNFDQTIGNAMLTTRNRNYEVSQTDLNTNRSYEKEYYETMLIGDPSLTFDPNLDLQQSLEVDTENGEHIVSYSLRPNYDVIEVNGSYHLIFNDPDDYIIEPNKPVVPIYKRKFELPTDSELLGFSIDITDTETYDGIELPIINPDPNYFVNETFNGQFPMEFYWNYKFDLLDERSIFDILVSPVIYHSNGTVEIFENIEVSFRYSSPVEITYINATDIVQDDTQNINLGIFNSLDQTESVDLIVRINTDEFEDEISKGLELEPGENLVEIDFDDTDYLGDYSISAVVTGDQIIAGPKYTYFTVSTGTFIKKFWYPISDFFKKTFGGFFKRTRSFKEDYKIIKDGDKTILNYESVEMRIHIEQDRDKTLSLIRTPKGELEIHQESGSLEYKLLTPRGTLNIIKEKGQIKQDSTGDPEKLKEILNEIMNNYKAKLGELDLVS